MEEEIIFESLEKHEGLQHFVRSHQFLFEFSIITSHLLQNIEDKISDEEKQKIMDSFGGSQRGASVFVAKDNHFQNKSQAVLVADACKAMFEVNETVKNKL